MTPRVAVNLLWCVPGEVGGSEQYLVRQLAGLSARAGAPEATLLCLESFARAHPDLVARHPTATAPIDGLSRGRRILAEHGWLTRRSSGFDLVHHGGGTTPLAGPRPIVLTVHDLQYLTFPRYAAPLKLRYLRAVVPRSVERSTVVTVPTDYVRRTVVDRFDIDADDVVVVPHGVGSELGRAAPGADELRSRHGLGDGPVLVLPAITHPHKGHVFLLEVVARSWTDPDLRLVLLGGAGSADDEVTAAIERLGLAGRVVRLGRVDDAERDGLIALADALVFPSEYEGFGAPIVEAMALGTPVICSDQPALAEVASDAAIVLPLDADAWSGAIDRLEREAPALRQAGLRRARDFTTEASGAALEAAYRRALGR
ncbi:glycosyltransferase family 4 protein [Ilumatobacter sp.]|uniref:glycosyltransferase family 4 protein n=1 Tax=Ilumatobacter sp. TaxID=1967498 RepID=UPI003B521602